jgi:chemotaxis protein histidine kinase CheA
MATLTEYFETEARRYLDWLAELGAESTPDAEELYRNARGLRGSAQMAREDRVYRSALALEAGARAVAQGALAWSENVATSLRQSVDDLRTLVDRAADTDLDDVASGSVERWSNAGVTVPGGVTGGTGAGGGPGESAGSSTAAARDAAQEFRAFAATEVEGIADALGTGVEALSRDPMDRDALKSILRRQRALLGAARLDEIPVVAEILRAIEDLTRVIAKLDVGVKREWLDIYRVACDGLKNASESLRTDENPAPSHPLARLRHMRAELLERYGTGEAVSAAAGPEPGLVQAQPAPSPQDASALQDASAETPVVDIATLQYTRDDALRRAAELRATLEAALPPGAAAHAALEELFDLIRLAQE